MSYLVAERFKSIQGEGYWTGTAMAFVRFVGCSVGKRICTACDTDFDRTFPWRGGGQYSAQELVHWALPYQHVCLTGGEPLDQELDPILEEAALHDMHVHIESSGTVVRDVPGGVWLCVSPKPGWRTQMLERADEIKVIVPGLGLGDGWPQLADALSWAEGRTKPVWLQPRNGRSAVDKTNLQLCLELVKAYSQLRLSVQLHKVVEER